MQNATFWERFGGSYVCQGRFYASRRSHWKCPYVMELLVQRQIRRRNFCNRSLRPESPGESPRWKLMIISGSPITCQERNCARHGVMKALLDPHNNSDVIP